MADNPATVQQPRHPLYALTTYELAGYRRQLESAIKLFDKTDPAPGAG
jgi:hypothetical protein